jgi:hypothetical protein
MTVKRMIVGLMFVAVWGAGSLPVGAATVLREEPAKGKLPAGETVLVDNGRCPKGQIMEVKAGANRRLGTGAKLSGSERTHRCIHRP